MSPSQYLFHFSIAPMTLVLTNPTTTALLSSTNFLIPKNKLTFPRLLNTATKCGKQANLQLHSWWKLQQGATSPTARPSATLRFADRLLCNSLLTARENLNAA